MFYLKQYSWSWLNVCSSHQLQYMFLPLRTDVILLRLSLGLRPLIRQNVSLLWQPVSTSKKKKRKHYDPLYFLYGWLWLCVQASVRLHVTAVSCDVAMTTDYAQRDRLRVKNQPPVTKSSERHGELSGLKISVFWEKQDRRKVDINIEEKKGENSRTSLVRNTVWHPQQVL